MECLRSLPVGDNEVAAVLCVDVGALQRDGPPARVVHLGLAAVVEEESVGEDEPSLLVALDVVRPLVQPALKIGEWIGTIGIATEVKGAQGRSYGDVGFIDISLSWTIVRIGTSVVVGTKPYAFHEFLSLTFVSADGGVGGLPSDVPAAAAAAAAATSAFLIPVAAFTDGEGDFEDGDGDGALMCSPPPVVEDDAEELDMEEELARDLLRRTRITSRKRDRIAHSPDRSGTLSLLS